tara:strand:- start:378 stop:1001 length:624 start_codon:yes stop_codon:yes gene_type:complete
MQRMGHIHGTGAALNVEIGWVPDYVKIVNLTDGDKIYENFLGKVIAFTSGGLATAVNGSKEIKPGDKLTGLTTTGTTTVIREIIMDSGSWSAGDAAGWLISNAEDNVGVFGSENAEVNDSGGNDITVAVADEDGIDVDTEVAGTTTAATNIQSYVGDADSGYAKGFTVGSTVSEDGKLLGFLALRNTQGEEAAACMVAGVMQKDGVW